MSLVRLRGFWDARDVTEAHEHSGFSAASGNRDPAGIPPGFTPIRGSVSPGDQEVDAVDFRFEARPVCGSQTIQHSRNIRFNIVTFLIEYCSLLLILMTAAYALWVSLKTDNRWAVLPAVFLFILSLNQISQLYYFQFLTRYIDVQIPYWTQAPQSITNMLAATVVLLLLIHLRRTHVNRTLLREMQHRIKNNLQMVSSLLGLQAGRTEDENVRRELKVARDRLRSMAFLHDQFAEDRTDRVQFRTYVRELMRGIVPDETPAVRWEVEVEACSLPMETALIGGLIINELVTNALQHAHPAGEEPGILAVKITFARRNDGEYRLEVTDNGTGLPEDFDLRTDDSFGLTIVRELVRKELDGTIGVNRSGGTTFRIDFPQNPHDD